MKTKTLVTAAVVVGSITIAVISGAIYSNWEKESSVVSARYEKTLDRGEIYKRNNLEIYEIESKYKMVLGTKAYFSKEDIARIEFLNQQNSNIFK